MGSERVSAFQISPLIFMYPEGFKAFVTVAILPTYPEGFSLMSDGRSM